MPEEKPLRVLLFGATFDTQNMGVGALASGSIRCLTGQRRRVSISLLDYGTDTTVKALDEQGTQISIPVVAMRFSKKLYLPNNIVVLLCLATLLRVIPIVRVRERIVAWNKCLREICAPNLIAAISGGDSFSDIYGLERFLYVSLPLLLTIILRKKLVLLPQTFGPFSGRLPRFIAQWILRRAERAYSRDREGLDVVRALVGAGYDAKKHALSYDVGFIVEPRKACHVEFIGIPANAKCSSVLVGLNVSGLLLSGGYTRNNMFGLRTDYRKLIYRIVDELILKQKATVLLIPHVFGAEPGSESDVLACEDVFAELSSRYDGHLGIVRGTFDQCSIKYVIGQCDFFVGSRMHACIAALSQGIPAVTIAYSRKFLGVLGTIGLPHLVADARKLNENQVIEVIDTALDGREHIAAYLSKRMPSVKESILRLGDDMLGCPSEHSREPLVSLSDAAVSSVV